MINNIRFTTIIVRDMEKALSFYRDLLGLKIELDAVKHAKHEKYIDKFMGGRNIILRVVKLSTAKGEALLELMEYISPKPKFLKRKSLFQAGPSSFAIGVKDIGALYKRLKKAGVGFINPPVLSHDKKAKVAFCEAPDNAYIQLVELL